MVFGWGLVAGMAAAVFSGFVGPALASEILRAKPAEYENWRLLFHLNGQLNQAFARVFIVASAIGISLWSLAALISRRLPAAPGVLRAVGRHGYLIVSPHWILAPQHPWFWSGNASYWYLVHSYGHRALADACDIRALTGISLRRREAQTSIFDWGALRLNSCPAARYATNL